MGIDYMKVKSGEDLKLYYKILELKRYKAELLESKKINKGGKR